MSQPLRYPTAQELARWHAHDAVQKQALADRAEALKQAFGDRFAREAGGADNAHVRDLAVDKMASLYAERETRPDLVDGSTWREIREQALKHASDLDDHQLAHDLGPYAREPPTPEAAPEATITAPSTPAAPAEDHAAPDRQPEGDRPLAVEQRPELLAEPTPGHAPDVDAKPQAASSQDLSDVREEIRREVQGEHLEGPAQAGEGPTTVEHGAGQEHEAAAPLRSVEAAQPAMTAEPAGQDQAERGAPDQAEPEAKRLRFYEDLKLEHAQARADHADKHDGPEKEQKEAGRKALTFFEDHAPPHEHGMEH